MNKGFKVVKELDQVAGNVEDEIGERLTAMRETELLYGPRITDDVLRTFTVHVCGSPHKFKVAQTLCSSFTNAHDRPPEPNPPCDWHIVLCQIPLCQLTIFAIIIITCFSRFSRPQKTQVSVVTLSSDVAMSFSRVSWTRTATSSTKVSRTLTWSEQYIHSAHVSHLQRDDRGERSTGRDGQVFRGRRTASVALGKVVLYGTVDERLCDL